MYVEDLVLHICNPSNNVNNNCLTVRDKAFIYSINKQLKKQLALTEKQADLLITILSIYKDFYTDIKDFDRIVSKPIYKNQFRQVDRDNIISIKTYNDKDYIKIQYCFNKKIKSILSSLNCQVEWDGKDILYKINASSIYKIVTALKEFNFIVDKQILAWYEEILDIKKRIDLYIPKIDLVNNELIISSASKVVQEYFYKNKTDDLLENIFLSKRLGLSIGSNLTYQLFETYNDETLRTLIESKENKFSLKENKDIREIVRFIHQYPTVVILNNDGLMDKDLDFWFNFFYKEGIDSADMSVLCRSKLNRDFNKQVKEKKLNNYVSEKTKIIFIKDKVPKIFYKLGIYPNLIILKSNAISHVSTVRMVDSCPLVLYYNQSKNQSYGGKNVVKL